MLVSRMTSDVDSLAELVQIGLQQFLMNTLLLVFSVIVLAHRVVAAAAALPGRACRSWCSPASSSSATRTGPTSTCATASAARCRSLQEGIAGVRVIQAYGREDVEIDRFADENRALYDAHMQSVWVQAWYLPVIELAGLGTTALVVGVGGWMTINGAITIGTIAFFVLTLGNLFDPIQQLSQLFNTVQSAGAGLQQAVRAARHRGRRRRAARRRRPARRGATSSSTT